MQTYVIGGSLLVLVALNVVMAPPEYVVADPEPIQAVANLDGNPIKLDARLTWHVDSFGITRFFRFIPGTRELVLHNASRGVTWELKPEFVDDLEAAYASTPLLPYWRYALATFSSLLLALIFGATEFASAWRFDRKRWTETRAEDSFIAYNKYLLEERRIKRHKSAARLGRRRKVKEYRAFYAMLAKQRDGAGTNALLEILDSIAERDSLTVGVSFSFTNKIREMKENFALERAKGELILGGMDRAQNPDEYDRIKGVVDNLIARASWNILEVGPQFTPSKNASREGIVTVLIDRVFANVFPERIIRFERDAADADVQLSVDYTVTTTGAFYTARSDDKEPENKRKHFTGIGFEWHLVMRRSGRKLLDARFESKPANNFSVSSSGIDDIYKVMAMTAFVEFGKQLLGYFGLGSSGGVEAMAASQANLIARRQAMKKLFEHFSKECLKDAGENLLEDAVTQFIDDHGKDIARAVTGVTLEIESMVSAFSAGLAQGIDIGDMGADAVASLFDF